MADKNFKVKTSITSPTPIALSEGGTGQTTANNALNALLPLQNSSSGYYLKTDGSNSYWSSLPAQSFVQITTTSISSNTILNVNTRYLVDTSSAITLTLPSSPSDGDEIQIFDKSGLAATNNITINRNGNNINGQGDNAIIDISGANSFIYAGSTIGWRFI